MKSKWRRFEETARRHAAESRSAADLWATTAADLRALGSSLRRIGDGAAALSVALARGAEAVQLLPVAVDRAWVESLPRVEPTRAGAYQGLEVRPHLLNPDMVVLSRPSRREFLEFLELGFEGSGGGRWIDGRRP